MTTDELLDRAYAALQRVMMLPPRSVGRAVQDALLDTYRAELRRRAVRFILGKLER